MKKVNVTVDFENKLLVMSKAFYKKACAFGSKENIELREAMETYKGYSTKFKVSDKLGYICTGGGALIRFLTGEELPVIKALRFAAKRDA